MGSLLSSESAYKRAREYIESSVRANKVMLFTKSNCGSDPALSPPSIPVTSRSYCELVIHILNNMEVPFGEAQIDQMKDGSYVHDKLIGMTGMRSVPNVWVNGKFVGGYEGVPAS